MVLHTYLTQRSTMNEYTFHHRIIIEYIYTPFRSSSIEISGKNWFKLMLCRGREVKAQYQTGVRFVVLSKDRSIECARFESEFQPTWHGIGHRFSILQRRVGPGPGQRLRRWSIANNIETCHPRIPYTAIPFHVYFVLFSDRWPIPSRAILRTEWPT